MFLRSLKRRSKARAQHDARRPHFVANYEAFVEGLLAQHPSREAMDLAVGGGFEEIGAVEANILRWVGLRDGMSLVDMGCGSGRLAVALSTTLTVDYTGLDAVQALLDYARDRSPPNYRFMKISDLVLPLPSQSADMIAVFAVFAHMLSSEAFLYLRDMFRILKPGGCVVMSFIEIAEPDHWADFMAEVESHRTSTFLHQFIERPTLDIWSDKIGFVREAFVDKHAAPWGGGALGQSLAVLRRP